MNKFTSPDLAAIKTGKTEFKKLVNQIAKNSIFKSPTISFFNKKGNLAVLKNLDYQLQDLGNLIKAYRFEYKELINKYADNEFSARTTLSARKPAPKKKTLSARGYKRPAFDLETSGTYIFQTPKKDYIVKSYLFERENETEDSLQIQNELRSELGAIIIKNSAWRNLANGKTITARSSKGQKGKLTKLK
jgi:hypothetical protein